MNEPTGKSFNELAQEAHAKEAAEKSNHPIPPGYGVPLPQGPIPPGSPGLPMPWAPGLVRVRPGKPGTFTIEERATIIRHTENGDEVMIDQKTTQEGAPITTVLVAEATEVMKLCRRLAAGAEAASLSLDGPRKAWVLKVAALARAVELLPEPAPEG